RPGEYGRVRAVTSLKEGALVVPQRAVTELQGRYSVAVVGSDNKVSIREVKIGDRVGSMWIIEEGLKAGESVVAEGTQKVRTDTVVNPKPFTATAEQKSSGFPITVGAGLVPARIAEGNDKHQCWNNSIVI